MSVCKRFQWIARDGERNYVYDNWHDVDRFSVVSGSVSSRMFCGGYGALCRCNEATLIDMLSSSCTEDKVHAYR